MTTEAQQCRRNQSGCLPKSHLWCHTHAIRSFWHLCQWCIQYIGGIRGWKLAWSNSLDRLWGVLRGVDLDIKQNGIWIKNWISWWLHFRSKAASPHTYLMGANSWQHDDKLWCEIWTMNGVQKEKSKGCYYCSSQLRWDWIVHRHGKKTNNPSRRYGSGAVRYSNFNCLPKVAEIKVVKNTPSFHRWFPKNITKIDWKRG